MPEPSDNDRRKAAGLNPSFAQMRLIDALERDWVIHFRCQYYGAGKSWHREKMLGAHRRYLNCTMSEIQARVPCPHCPGRVPIMTMSGVIEPADQERRRRATVKRLVDSGLDPTDYG
jgi:hypothetical protein